MLSLRDTLLLPNLAPSDYWSKLHLCSGDQPRASYQRFFVLSKYLCRLCILTWTCIQTFTGGPQDSSTSHLSIQQACSGQCWVESPPPQNYSSLLEVASALVKQYLYLQKSVLVLCLSEVSRNSHSHKMRKPQRKEFKFNPKITSSKFLKMPVRFYGQELLLGNTP